MVYISAKLTMVMLAVVPPVSIGAVIYGRYLRKLSNQTQEALGDMSKVSRPLFTCSPELHPCFRQTAEEKLNAFKTVAAFNAQTLEGTRFSHKVDKVFQLAKKEAIASGIFFGGSGLTGNLTMLCLLGYGMLSAVGMPVSLFANISQLRGSPRFSWGNHGWRSHEFADLHWVRIRDLACLQELTCY
jgi:ABC-type multidrug transport system fused ATPase/permease subunit